MCRTTGPAGRHTGNPALNPEDSYPIDTANVQFKNDQPVGDTCMTPKPKGTWRIGVLNPNGVSVGNAGSLPILLEGVKGMQADAFFLSETKLATDQPWVQEQVSKCCGRTYGRKHKVITASSDIPFHVSILSHKANYKQQKCMELTSQIYIMQTLLLQE